MIVTVLGGSAHSTPTLFDFLATQHDLPKLEFRLVGRSEVKLAAVRRASKIVLRKSNISVNCYRTNSKEIGKALSGSDLVIVQPRIGALSGRLFDETFPLRHRLCGDEGLGLGGLSAAWRAWPIIKRLMALVGFVCPEAFILMVSSPVSLLTRLVCHSFPQLRIAGICELPWTTLKNVCESLHVPPSEVHFSYSGINHIGWFHSLSLGSRNLIDEYASTRLGSSEFPSGDLIRSCGGIPLKYLRLHYESIQMLEEQRTHPPRASVLLRLASDAFQVYRNGNRQEITRTLSRRPAPWYTDAIGPFILGCAGQPAGIPCFLSVGDQNFDVVEVPHENHAGTWVACKSTSPGPLRIQETLESFVSYERLAAEAVCSRDAQQLSVAVAAHPWIKAMEDVPDLVRDIVSHPMPDNTQP